jgi:molybdopterin molybdotransferase
MAELLNVDLALARILEYITPLDSEPIPLTAALGRVLGENIISDVNIPPFPNSSMDGFAVRAADLTGETRLRVIMDIPAGTAPTRALQTGEAARIMTGAPMPDGADAVVPVEQTDVQFSINDALPEHVTVRQAVKSGDYVRAAGEDFGAGQLIIGAGKLLRPQEIGVLAALGRAQVVVVRQPRVAILSSGDELLTVDEPLTAGKIRDVNAYTLSSLVADNGGKPLPLPIAKDTLESVRTLFREALAQQPDMIISSAGVSVGSFDLVRTVLAELGKVDFWKINLRPGKPLAFGELHDAQGRAVPFFGLPGNPVSAMVTFDVLVRPALLKMQGRADDAVVLPVIVGENMNSDGRRSYLRVKLTRDEQGRLTAHSTGTQSSGALTSMIAADGLLIVPEDVTRIEAGTTLTARLLRQM